MIRHPQLHLLLAGTLAVTLAAGCQPKAAVQVGTAPVTPTATQSQTAGVSGRADINGQAFAGAEVKIYKPGETTPIATATTGPDGRFNIPLGVIATGGGNVIATGGGNVIATGGGNVIATGGGNFAAGSPLKVVASKEGQTLAGLAVAGVIATGGGNVIATGGGNVIATGGGNVIATGGGNFGDRRVLQAQAPREAVVSLATTLAFRKLGNKLDAALKAVFFGDTIDERAVADVLKSFEKVEAAAQQALTNASADEIAAIAQSLDAQGQPSTSTAVAEQLEQLEAALETVFKEVEQQLEAATETPTAPDSPEPPAPQPNTTIGTSGSGDNGVDRDDDNRSSGNVAISGHFDPPMPRSSASAPPPAPVNERVIYLDGFVDGNWSTTMAAGMIENVAAPVQHGTQAFHFAATNSPGTPSMSFYDSAPIAGGFANLHLLMYPDSTSAIGIQALDVSGAPIGQVQNLAAFFSVENGAYDVYNVPLSAFAAPTSTIAGFKFTPSSPAGMTPSFYLDDIRLQGNTF